MTTLSGGTIFKHDILHLSIVIVVLISVDVCSCFVGRYVWRVATIAVGTCGGCHYSCGYVWRVATIAVVWEWMECIRST